MMQELYLYDKRHGWKKPSNFADVFNEKQSTLLNNLDLKFLTSDYYFSEIDLNQDSIINKVIDIFDSFPYYETHTKAMVMMRIQD